MACRRTGDNRVPIKFNDAKTNITNYFGAKWLITIGWRHKHTTELLVGYLRNNAVRVCCSGSQPSNFAIVNCGLAGKQQNLLKFGFVAVICMCFCVSRRMCECVCIVFGLCAARWPWWRPALTRTTATLRRSFQIFEINAMNIGLNWWRLQIRDDG